MESDHADSGSGVGAGHADAGIRERWVTRTYLKRQSGTLDDCLLINISRGLSYNGHFYDPIRMVKNRGS